MFEVAVVCLLALAVLWIYECRQILRRIERQDEGILAVLQRIEAAIEKIYSKSQGH